MSAAKRRCLSRQHAATYRHSWAVLVAAHRTTRRSSLGGATSLAYVTLYHETTSFPVKTPRFARHANNRA